MVEGENDLVVIFQTQDDSEARIVEGLLKANDIYCYLTSHITHSVYPLTVDGLGEVRLVVTSAQAEEARKIIADHLEENGGEKQDE